MANIIGTSGNDYLSGTTGDDTISAGAGNDIIDDGGGGHDTILAGSGNDTIMLERFDPDDRSVVFVDAGDGTDFLGIEAGHLGHISATMGAGNDLVSIIGTGNFTVELTLGPGSDRVEFEGVAPVTITDFETGQGGDSLDISTFLRMRAAAWNYADDPFAAGFLQLVQKGPDAVLFAYFGGAASNEAVPLAIFAHTRVETFTAFNFVGFDPSTDMRVPPADFAGTPNDDLYAGTSANELILGGDGNDTLSGGAGDDTIRGGAGNDTIDGRAGIDHIEAGDGDDTIVFSGNADTYDGGAGFDTLDFSRGGIIWAERVDLDFSGLVHGQPILIGGRATTGIEAVLYNGLHSDAADRIVFGDGFSIGRDLFGGGGDDVLVGTAGSDRIDGGSGNDQIDGGEGLDTAVFSGSFAQTEITRYGERGFQVYGSDGLDQLVNIEYARFADMTVSLDPVRGVGIAVSFGPGDPAAYRAEMERIRDFDGNDLGGNGNWRWIGATDVNGDGDADQILVNQAIGRFATVGASGEGYVYFSDHSWNGETRVAGIYIDPLVASGQVIPGSDFDSQARFQNDLFISNIGRVLGADDYDRDGLQEVYFALTDGTAYLHAYMHADGNIRYANYQSQAQVRDFLTGHGYGEETFGDWFSNTAEPLDAKTTAAAFETADMAVAPAPKDFAFVPLDEIAGTIFIG